MKFPVTNTGARRCSRAAGQASRGTLQAKRSIHNIIARHLGAETGSALIAPVTEEHGCAGPVT